METDVESFEGLDETAEDKLIARLFAGTVIVIFALCAACTMAAETTSSGWML